MVPADDSQRKRAIQQMEKTIRGRRLPDTDSIEKLAGFWDRHDLTDFEDDLEHEPSDSESSHSILKILRPPPAKLRNPAACPVKRPSRVTAYRDGGKCYFTPHYLDEDAWARAHLTANALRVFCG
jgi:hypothetical protein